MSRVPGTMSVPIVYQGQRLGREPLVGGGEVKATSAPSLFWDAPERPDRQFVTRDCLYCDAAGATAGCAGPIPCEECDGTGRKYRAVWTTDDGVTCSMTGSGATPPDANARSLMELVARAALEVTK